MAKKEENKEEIKAITTKEPTVTYKSFNIDDYKDQIDKYIKERAEKELASETAKIYKRQIHKKNISNLIKDIVIVVLIGVIGFGVYYGYNHDWFNINKTKEENSNKTNNNSNNNNENNKKEENKEQENKGPSLEELINKYGDLLDNINMYDNSIYIKDYYNGNLTDSLKLSLAYYLVKEDSIFLNDSSLYFEEDVLEDAYNEIFNGEMKLVSFNAHNVNYQYLKLKNIYFGVGTLTLGNKIDKEIIDIKEENNKVIITTVEGLIKNNKLYNILTNKEIREYKSTNKLSDYKSKLNQVKYIFDSKNNVYYLQNIEK